MNTDNLRRLLVAVPEYVVAAFLASLLSLFGVSFRKLDHSDKRMDALELKVAENYVTKAEVREQLAELFIILRRLEDKMDAQQQARR